MNKQYLGDAVYAEWIGFGDLVLTTEEDGPERPRNRIVLGRSEWGALLAFVEHDERADDHSRSTTSVTWEITP